MIAVRATQRGLQSAQLQRHKNLEVHAWDVKFTLYIETPVLKCTCTAQLPEASLPAPTQQLSSTTPLLLH